jgi:hypothetical protein
VRLGASRLFEPAVFAEKRDGLPTTDVAFSSKILFDWSQNWSTQTQVYALPLYRLYRGGFSRKPNSNYWSSIGSSFAEYDQFL